MIKADPILVLEDVHAAYLKKEVLRGLSLIVHAGEIVALLGENGSGKSTTLKVIAGLLKPSQGIVRFQGRNLNALGVAQRQHLGIGYLMQGGRVFPNLTVKENFALATSNSHESQRPAILGDWFPVLRDCCSIRAGLLSGGQRQMLAIEMVLVQKPSLLLLDEPIAALSPDMASNILASIRHCSESTGTPVLLVEQNVSAAISSSHRILYLSSGTSTTHTK
jgi:ABC-type branched-subunit amino acid transport system ATPase component